MKNQYFGDVNDYRKYGLIRLLVDGGKIKTGVCWMLTPDDTRADGKFTEYLADPKKYKDFDPDLYEFLSQCISSNARNVLEVVKSDKFPSTVFYNPILKDDAVQREQYFSNMYNLFQDVDLIFFDPDNGLEVKSKLLGQKDSSKYLYWSEVVKCYKAGHSILIYQHFIREDRNKFISRILENISTKTGSKNTISFRTSNVVFFLICQDKHNQYFLSMSKIILGKWAGQIQVFPQIEEASDEILDEEWENQMGRVYEENMGKPDLLELEGWFPAIARYAFEDAQTRLRLHHKFNDKKIISLLNQYDKTINRAEKKAQGKGGDVDFPPSFPLFDLPEFGVLRLLRKAKELGKEEGRILLMGVENADVLMIGEKRRLQMKEWSDKGQKQRRQNIRDEEKEKLPQYQAAIDRLHTKNPNLKWTPLTNRVAKDFNLSGRQLRRKPLRKPPNFSK
jgi:hypothetical protein